MADRRCFDCLEELGPRRFVVLKQMRDLPSESELAELGGAERSYAITSCFDEVTVCPDCAGWYGDEAVDVSDDSNAAEDQMLDQKAERLDAANMDALDAEVSHG